MRRYEDGVMNNSGSAIAGASVTVYAAGTTNKATIYSDDGVTPIANPVTTDAMGRFAFYVKDGKYDLHVTSSTTVAYTQAGVVIDDPFEANVGDTNPVFNTVGASVGNFGSIVVSDECEVDGNLLANGGFQGVIGGGTPAAGTFTTLAATTANVPTVNATTVNATTVTAPTVNGVTTVQGTTGAALVIHAGTSGTNGRDINVVGGTGGVVGGNVNITGGSSPGLSGNITLTTSGFAPIALNASGGITVNSLPQPICVATAKQANINTTVGSATLLASATAGTYRVLIEQHPTVNGSGGTCNSNATNTVTIAWTSSAGQATTLASVLPVQPALSSWNVSTIQVFDAAGSISYSSTYADGNCSTQPAVTYTVILDSLL